MIDTIVIAAAGRGSRMKHLSEDKPKHLITVAGKPFLHHLLKAVHDAGFKRIVVVIGYKADVMREFLENEPYDVEIVDQNEKAPGKYGTAVVVEVVADVVNGKPFVFKNGDSLYTKEVFQSVMVDDGYTRVVGAYNEDPTNYGVVEADANGLLKRIVEKPKEPICNVINLGIYGFQPDVIDAIKQVKRSPRKEYEIVDAINILAKQNKVKVEQLEGEWVDLGKPQDIETVERFLVKHNYI